MSTETKLIKLCHDGRKISMRVTNGFLSKKSLNSQFPNATGLSYDFNGEPVGVEVVDGGFQLDPTVNIYDVFIPQGAAVKVCGAKKRRLEEMLEDCSSYVHKVVSPASNLDNKKDYNSDHQAANDSQTEKFVKRVAYVSWKHRNSEFDTYENLNILSTEKIVLNFKEDYSLSSLKAHFVQELLQLKPQKLKFYFDNSSIQLADQQDNIIEYFKDSAGDICNFWKFQKQLRKGKGDRLYINVLTTFKTSFQPLKDLVINSPDKTKTVPLKNKKTKVTISQLLKKLPKTCAFDLNTKSKKSLFNTVKPNFATELQKPGSFINYSMKNESEIENVISVQDTSSEEKNYCASEVMKLIEEENKSFPNVAHLLKPNTINLSSKFTFPSKESSENDDNIKSKKYCDTSVVNNFSQKKTETSQVKIRSPKKQLTPKIFKIPSVVNKIPEAVNPLNKFHIKKIEEKDIEISEEILGKGGQGVVQKGTWAGTSVAVKIVQKGRFNKFTLREIQLLEKIRHKNIITIMAVSENPREYLIIMEYYNGKSLDDVIFKDRTLQLEYNLTMEKKNTIALEFCQTIQFLHLQKPPIIHRDIKPGNLLINKYCDIKICDLGMSTCTDLDEDLQSSSAGTIRGTYFYMAPEMYLHRSLPTTGTDVWAIACTLLELYTEKFTWGGQNIDTLLKMRSALEKQEIPKNISLLSIVDTPFFLKKLLENCFNYNEDKRATLNDILNEFRNEKKMFPDYFFSRE